MTRVAIAVLFLLSAPCFGADAPKLTVPDEIKAEAGAWVVVSPDTNCAAVVYVGLDGLAAFPSSELKDPRKLIVNPPPGAKRYRFVAVGTLGDVMVQAPFVVVVGNPTPTPDPSPNPGPGPMPIPGPPGARILIVYPKAAGGGAVMTKEQYNALSSQPLRDFFTSACAKAANGQAEWRIWSNGEDVSNESDVWKALYARPRQGQGPWIIISNGDKSFEGPLPATAADIQALVRQHTTG